MAAATTEAAEQDPVRRERPVPALQAWFGTPGVSDGLPRSVRVLIRLLVTGPERWIVRGVARRLLGM